MAFDPRAFINFVVENQVVGFFDEAITLKSGRKSFWYVNWRTPTTDAFLLDQLTDFIIEFLRQKGLKPDCLYGVPEGATKTALIANFKWAKQHNNYQKASHVMAMGRAKPKEHGDPKDKFFVGAPVGKTLVIEDVTTTGKSLFDELHRLIGAGVEVMGVLTLTNRMETREDGKSIEEAIKDTFNDEIPFYSMSQATTILPKAIEKLGLKTEITKQIQAHFDEYGVEPLRL